MIFGGLLFSHGIAKWSNFDTMSTMFPDPLGIGSSASLSLAIFGEVICSLGFIVGAFYRLALIPMIFTMCIAFFVIHGADPFAVKELALVYLAIFVLMYIAGPGNYSVDRLIAKKIGGGKYIIRKSKCSTDFKRNDFLKKNEAYPLGALRSLKFAYRKLRISLFVELAV